MTREIKKVGKYNYVYESSMVWDSEHSKRHKVSKYVGKVINGDINNPKKVREIVSIHGIYEIGHLELVFSLMKDVLSPLREEYPDDYMKIVAFSLNRLIFPLPLKYIKSWIEKTWLSRTIHELSPESLSSMLKRIGQNQDKQKSIYMKLMKRNEIIAYDTSALFSYSPGIRMAGFGHNNNDLNLPMIRTIMGFSRLRNEPCYIRLVLGSVADIDTLRKTEEELSPGTLFVMDRGFIDDNNFGKMDLNGLYFITPLKRDSKLPDYSINSNNFFMFRKRAIKYTSMTVKNYDIHVFEDILLRAMEENEYYSLIDSGKKPLYSPEKAGKIALITNVREKPQSIFELYKFRNDIEESFDVFKNLLQVDTPYIRDDDTLKGYVFVSFISLIAYYRLLKLLKEKKINNKISVKDALLQLSKIYLTDVGDRIIMAEIPKKVRELAEILELKPELFPKNVLS
ncbi:transposase [Ferroplasma sp.]|uniref:transposase n=1 Tax=Ferroplasma sp. TaxID=2591003 RepID=UPI002610DCDF|nr:transposase [Ferroplasma sp.]